MRSIAVGLFVLLVTLGANLAHNHNTPPFEEYTPFDWRGNYTVEGDCSLKVLLPNYPTALGRCEFAVDDKHDRVYFDLDVAGKYWTFKNETLVLFKIPQTTKNWDFGSGKDTIFL